jgi:hypothetical protein
MVTTVSNPSLNVAASDLVQRWALESRRRYQPATTGHSSEFVVCSSPAHIPHDDHDVGTLRRRTGLIESEFDVMGSGVHRASLAETKASQSRAG